MTEAHTQRAHAKLSPSASHRWMECPGSIRLSEGIESKSSTFADEGTAAHTLAAYCLESGQNADKHLGRWIDLDSPYGGDRGACSPDRGFRADEEMVESVQVYLDYVRGHDGDLTVEAKFDLQHVHPGMFGTGDAVIYNEKTHHLIVADFKYGRGVAVEPAENPQLLSYGVGVVRRYHNRHVGQVTLAVIQPRCRHPQGAIREWHTDAITLLEFEHDLKLAALETEKPDAPLKAGDWCRFCPAAAICPALRAEVQQIAHDEFEAYSSPRVAASMSPEKLADVLNEVDVIKTWLRAVESYANEQAAAGVKIPGWKLVAKRAIRKWKDPIGLPAVLIMLHDIDEDDLYEPREIKSPAQVEAFMPGKNKKAREMALSEYVTKESSGLVLAPESDVRPAARSDGSEFAGVA